MKNILYILLFIGISANAQDQFKYEKVGKQAIINDYIVIEKEGTAEELYEYVNDWVLKTWTDPEAITKANDGDSYIRVRGHAPGISSPISLGFRPWVFVRGYYVLSFRFKDNKIKMSLLSFDFNENVYAGSLVGWVNVDYNYKEVAITNKSGKKLKPLRVAMVSNIANYYNGLAASLKIHDVNEEVKSDW